MVISIVRMAKMSKTVQVSILFLLSSAYYVHMYSSVIHLLSDRILVTIGAHFLFYHNLAIFEAYPKFTAHILIRNT